MDAEGNPLEQGGDGWYSVSRDIKMQITYQGEESAISVFFIPTGTQMISRREQLAVYDPYEEGANGITIVAKEGFEKTVIISVPVEKISAGQVYVMLEGVNEAVISSEQFNIFYEAALAGELPMETTTGEWDGKEESFIYYVYRLTDGDEFLRMWVEDEQKPGKILINGQEYPYSFGEYYPHGGENPQVCVKDINGDGEPDILMRGEAYRAQIRQEVYLSDGSGGYRELGDVTWRWESL